PNQAPTAAFTATPSSPATGDEVSFNASTSSDPDGSIAKYEWDLDGNGSYETDGGTSSDASTSYDTPGTRTVSLRVTDDDGATATSSQQVEVVAAEIVPAYDFDLAFNGTRATLSYVANQPVNGRLEVVLRGSAQHRWSTIVRNVRTTSATGDVSLTTGVQHVKQKCRRYRRCVIDVTADVTHLGDSLFHDTDGWSSKR
ncbi:MAG: hypothetical protein QOG09_541, partial [Solirubrobacterales bacterium]|nr:hypothetical protein [Solirubrobacterales bacterium]